MNNVIFILLMLFFIYMLAQFTTTASAQTSTDVDHVIVKGKRIKSKPKPSRVKRLRQRRVKRNKLKKPKLTRSRIKINPRAIKNKTLKKQIHGRLNKPKGKVNIKGVKDTKNVRCNKKCKLIKLELLWYKNILRSDKAIQDAYKYERNLDKFKKLKYKKKQRGVKR